MTNVVSTAHFKRNAKKLIRKYPSLVGEIERLIDLLEKEPFQGISLGRDCYKIRLAIASKGRGKSGGGRVVTCVKIENDVVHLLTIYDKAEKEDLEPNELDGILEDEGLLPDN